MDNSRLIVAADYGVVLGEGVRSVERQVLLLASKLAGTGVTLKVNSALRICGYRLIDDIGRFGLRVFADLKLDDIPATLALDGTFLRGFVPRFVTVKCSAGLAAMRVLKAELPKTQVIGITVLTSIKPAEAKTMYGCPLEDTVVMFARNAAEAGLDGIVCAPTEVAQVRSVIPGYMSIITPNIRLGPTTVVGDDQDTNRARTPKEAISLGATHLVVGRPITQAFDPREVVHRILAEMED